MQAYFAVDPAQLLRLEGADATDLLHRISATELRDQVPGSCRRLLFCDDKGRMVDLPLARREPEAWWLLANEGSAETLASWIERFVITEELSVQRAPTTAWSLAIDGCAEMLEEGAPVGQAPPAAELHAHWIREGLLRPRRAFARKLHPLECGLRSSISFTKGCYVGQEVVARMDSYDKIQRALHWLRGAGAAPREDASLLHGDRVVGRVLESCPDGEHGYQALAQLALDVEPTEAFEVEGAEPGRATRVPDSAN